MKYINKGICIFCKRDGFEATFNEKPHTMPRSLGSNSIGFDVCDECNHYFGEPDKLSNPQLGIELCVKEILGLTKHLLQYQLKSNTKRLKSIFFEFYASKAKLKVKSKYQLFIPNFQKTLLNQFKRGLYEMFLQEYHKETKKGLEKCFDEIRNYARYNEGDIPLYHLQSSNGIVLIEDNLTTPKFTFTPNQINDIENLGFCSLIIFGKWFYLEVTPQAACNREDYLKNATKLIGFVFNQLLEVKSVNDIDFTLRNLFR